MTRLSIVVPTVDIGRLNASLPGWVVGACGQHEVLVMNGTKESGESIASNLKFLFDSRPGWSLRVLDDPEDEFGVMAAMYAGYKEAKEGVVAFLHDDTLVHETGWDIRVLSEFVNKEVGMVGFIGTVRKAELMAYGPWISNADDAEYFGERFDGSCEVEHLDGQALVVRKNFLDHSKEFHEVDKKKAKEAFYYDFWLCRLAKEGGYKLRCVGVRSYHISWLDGNGKHNRQMTL